MRAGTASFLQCEKNINNSELASQMSWNFLEIKGSTQISQKYKEQKETQSIESQNKHVSYIHFLDFPNNINLHIYSPMQPHGRQGYQITNNITSCWSSRARGITSWIIHILVGYQVKYLKKEKKLSYLSFGVTKLWVYMKQKEYQNW